jgi:aminocarboxymuconate-semialdehyde decarboxylase
MPVIDVHAHHVPEALLDITGGPLPADRRGGDITDLGSRLDSMDNQGIDIQVMSAWMGFLSRDTETARRHNDALADSVAKHPDRFVGLAVAPLETPADAPAEIERAVKKLDLRGVEIGSSVLGRNLDEPEFGPFFAKVEELGVPIFIHPVNPTLGVERLGKYRLENLIGNVTETAVAVASLIFGGVLEEFPRLLIYLAHGGGSCPYIRGRWDHGLQHQRLDAHTERLPSEYLKTLYYDALTHSTDALEYLVSLVGDDHVMLGTDYPFAMGELHPIEAIEATSLSVDAKRRITSDNAAQMFRL